VVGRRHAITGALGDVAVRRVARACHAAGPHRASPCRATTDQRAVRRRAADRGRDGGEPETEVDPEAERERREVSFGTDGDRWKLRADLPADEGALVEKALTASRSSVFHDRHPDVEVENPRTSDVTWADGLCRMAEATMVGLGRLGNRRPADRHQLLLHLNASGPDGIAQLHLGPAVPDCLRRFLTCDSDVRAIIEADGVLLALSKRLRIVDDQMRAFVEQRDGGCVVPGCLQRRWLHIHHIVHWEDGGPTETPNLCALCPLHHRMHHLGLLVIEGDPSRLIGARPPAPRARPPDQSSCRPYTHPSGEKVEWQWVDWQDLNQRRHDTS
jgi:hypothetical protein